MGRDVSISYRDAATGRETAVAVRPPYFILGTQATSKAFWGLPRLREVGITRLSELGETDPIWFEGWDGLAELKAEVDSLEQHLAAIDFDAELKAQWLAHLVYCYHLLIQTAPPDSVPRLSIG